jgi:hypothetical protein
MKMGKIGYKIIFCKKICDICNKVDGTKYPYRSFGHFDGFFIKPIYQIEDFEDNRYKEINEAKDAGSSQILFEGKLHDTYHSEKQTINLLNPKELYQRPEGIDIFAPELDEKTPIIVISMVNSHQNSMSVQRIMSIINDEINENDSTVLSVFETFAIEDCVIIFRSNSLQSILDKINNIRKNVCFEAINLYSIVGLAWNDSAKEVNVIEEDLYASIRLYARPGANFISVQNELVTWAATHINVSMVSIEEINKIYSFASMGRYDIQVCFRFRNIYQFMRLFDILNPGYAVSKPFQCIISSETTIMNDINDDVNRNFDIIKEEEEHESIQNWINQFSENTDKQLEKLSQTYDDQKLFDDRKEKWNVDVQNAVYMLIERAHQLYHAASSHKYADVIEKFARAFTLNIPDLLYSDKPYVTTADVQKFIKKIITNIDDLFSVSFRDFEYSQKDGMYVHASGKLLICLRNYVHYEMILAINAYKKLIKWPNDFLITHTTVVIEMLEGIGRYELPGKKYRHGKAGKIDEIKEKFGKGSYCVVEIPPKALFQLESTIFALSHEAGHFIRLSESVISYWATLATLLYAITIYDKEQYRTAFIKEKKRNLQTIENLDGDANVSIEDEFIKMLNIGGEIGEDEKKNLVKCLEAMKKFLYEFIADTFAVHSVILKPNSLEAMDDANHKRLKVMLANTIEENLPASEINGVHRDIRLMSILYTFRANPNKDIGEEYFSIFQNDAEVKINNKKLAYVKLGKDAKSIHNCIMVRSAAVVAETFYHFHLRSAFEKYSDKNKNIPSEKHKAFKKEYFAKSNQDQYELMLKFLETYQIDESK